MILFTRIFDDSVIDDGGTVNLHSHSIVRRGIESMST